MSYGWAKDADTHAQRSWQETQSTTSVRRSKFVEQGSRRDRRLRAQGWVPQCAVWYGTRIYVLLLSPSAVRDLPEED